MMRLALALMLTAGLVRPCFCQELVGEWQFTRQAYNGVNTGTIIVDRNGEARSKGRSPIQTYIQCGYVQAVGDSIAIVFTFAKGEHTGYSPDRFYCSKSGERALSCTNRDAVGNQEDAVFTVMRVGDEPVSAADRLEDLCLPRASPQA